MPDRTANALAADGVSVLLMGTGRYARGSGLPDVPAVHDTLYDLRDVLVDRCGARRDAVAVVEDPATRDQMGKAVVEAAKRATSVLVVYYVGHGLVSMRGGLHLAAVQTSVDSMELPFSALNYDDLRAAIMASEARSVVVILDCCFAGRAVNVLSVTETEDQVAQLAAYDGGFVLVAAGRSEMALAPVGARHTAFTGELINVLRSGWPEGPEQLTLTEVAGYLEWTLPAKDGPRPRRMASDRAGALVLTDNPLHRPRRVSVEPVVVAAPRYEGPSPYPGLAAFQAGDADRFFGRDALVGELVAAVNRSIATERCTAVVGPSGSGKSSLLRAGLVPAIGRGTLSAPEARGWPVLVCSPGATPARGLVDGVARLAGWDPFTVWSQCGRDPVRIAEAMADLSRERGGGRASRLVIVVDQFEEVFGAEVAAADRQLFIESLVAAAGGGPHGEPPAAVVVFGLRSDFYAHAAAVPELRTVLQDGQVVMRALDEAELVDAVRGPADAVGVGMEHGLVELLIRDVGLASGTDADQAAALPLLAHALWLTWQRCDGQMLTVAAYKRTGGVAGALAKTAEDVYQSLDAAQRPVADTILLRLVQLGENTRDVRRRLPVSALTAGLAGADAVLAAFASARLVTVDDQTAELSHEALIVAWHRLRSALTVDRWRLVESQKLALEAERWVAGGRDPSFLLLGNRLAAVRTLTDGTNQPANLTPEAEELLQASVGHESAVARGVRRRRRTVALGAALAVLGMVVAAGAVAFVLQSRASERERLLVSASRAAAATSSALRAANPSEALLLAVAAWRLAPTEEARSALLSTQTQPYAGTLTPPDHSHGEVSGIAIGGPNGPTAVARDGVIELWDVDQRRHLLDLTTDAGPVVAPTFSADAAVLVAATTAGVRTWNVRNGSPRTDVITGLAGATGLIRNPVDGTVTVSAPTGLWSVDPVTGRSRQLSRPDAGPLSDLGYGAGGRLLFGLVEHGAKIVGVDPTNGRTRVTIAADGISAVAIDPGGTVVAAGIADGTVRLFDAQTGQKISGWSGHDGAVRSVSFDSTGQTLATASDDRTVRIWNVASGQQFGEPLDGHRDGVRSVVFEPGGRTVVSGGADVLVWNLDHRPTQLLQGSSDAVAFRPDGRQIAVGGSDGRVHLWDVGARAQTPALAGFAAPVTAVGYSPLSGSSADGTYLLGAASADGTVRVWDTTTGNLFAGPLLTPRAPRELTVGKDAISLAVAGRDNVIRRWYDVPHDDYQDFTARQVVDVPTALTLEPATGALTVRSRQASQDYKPDGTPTGRLTPVSLPPTAGIAVSNADGSVRVTVGDDSLVRLWDNRNMLTAALSGPGDLVLAAAFADDRHTLATVSRDGALMVWDINPDRTAVEICEALRTDLTRATWNRYITEVSYRKVCPIT